MSEDFFTTTDPLLTPFLQVKGRELIEIQPNGEARLTFVFRNSEQINRDAKAFLENAPIPVKSLGKRMAKLRDACRELRRRPTSPQQGHEHENSQT